MKHKQELIDILMADAKLQFEYADNAGNTCAIGGIAEKFGWEPEILVDYNKMSIDIFMVHEHANKHPMQNALKMAMEHFGLDRHDLQAIQTVNDNHFEEGPRHDALKRLIESWEEE